MNCDNASRSFCSQFLTKRPSFKQNQMPTSMETAQERHDDGLSKMEHSNNTDPLTEPSIVLSIPDFLKDFECGPSDSDEEDLSSVSDYDPDDDVSNGLQFTLAMVQKLRKCASDGNLLELEKMSKAAASQSQTLSRGMNQSSTALDMNDANSTAERTIDGDKSKPFDTFCALLEDLDHEPRFYSSSDLTEQGYFVQGQVVTDMDMMLAARNNNVSVMQEKFNAGENLQICNKFRESIIHTAARRGSTEVLEFFQEHGVSLRVCCDCGRTPLHDACWTGRPNFEMIELFLEDHADFLFVKDNRGHTPLQYVPKDCFEEWNAFLRAHKDLLLPYDLEQISV